MEKEGLFYKGVFTLLSGFLLFIASILNQTYNLVPFLHDYYVLFLFTGFIFSILGIIFTFSWHFNTRSLFVNKSEKRKEHYIPYLGFGVFLILIGFFGNFYFNLSRHISLMFLIVASAGIVLMTMGALYYIKEVFGNKEKK